MASANGGYNLNKYLKYFYQLGLNKSLYKIKSKVYTTVAKLNTTYTLDKEPIPFEERLTREMKTVKKGQRWGEVFDCAWFNFKGTVPQSAKGKNVVLLIQVDGEGCLYDNDGNPQKGISNICGVMDFAQPARGKKVLEVTDSAVGGEQIDIWLDAGHNKLSVNTKNYAKLNQAEIAVFREDINQLYYDYLCLVMQLQTVEKGSEKHNSIKSTLRTTMKVVDDYSPEKITLAREVLASEMNFGDDSPYTFYAHGHAHLDLAWLWPIRETKRKVARTFSNTIYNIEKYPEYIFGGSQPQQFQWLKELYPALHEKVKTAIKNDRIEPQGKMWVECDTNVPSGESLIRQSLYGDKFWLDEYGKTSKICWLPDVFGFSGNLPQIIKKCGMDYFLTIKLSWNKVNKFPYRTFYWEGIDNSDILVHMPPEGTYNSDASPIALSIGVKRNSEKEHIKDMSLTYGIGDGGGGPSEGHIECALRQRTMKSNPIVKFSPAIALFDKLAKQKKNIPSYKGELYLETHQGTLTSQAKNKLYNRLLEKNLHNLELISTIAHLKNGEAYPYEMLETIWKEVLLYQFHDIIPGSSIKRVYDESVPRYEQMNEEILTKQAQILKTISNVKTPLYAINTTSYDRQEYLKYGEKHYKATVPALGSAKLVEVDTPIMDKMETDILRLDFDENGDIKSLYNKQLDKEFCGEYLNKLNIYKDKRSYYDAWDININYTKQKPSFFKLIGCQLYQDGSSIIRECMFKYKSSTLTQKIILTTGKPYVEFDNNIEWQETHKMLRAEFAPKVYSDEVTCDIQFGNIKRSTKNETSEEKAQFEIAAHKWVDVSSNDYGISLLNDCKYGHRVKDGVISLNLLRSPMWPAKDADKGIHNFRYALYPHAGDYVQAKVAKHGYIFNNSLIVSNASFNSFAKSSDNNIVIETIKMAENKEKQFIIRVYEDSGKERKAKLSLDAEYTKAEVCDMLENPIAECDINDLSFTPFEIKTIKITL